MLAVWSLAAVGCLLGASTARRRPPHRHRRPAACPGPVFEHRPPGGDPPAGSGHPLAGAASSASSASASCCSRAWRCWSSAPSSPGCSRHRSSRAWSASSSSPPPSGSCSAACSGPTPRTCSTREEHRALLIVGCALGFAIARALWSLGPAGELYAGTISRTLEVGGRSDSRIPFMILQLVANGGPPTAKPAPPFSPYNFSSRGPLAGLASTPVVLLTGGSRRRPAEQPWRPFDPQGFMAFRLAMMLRLPPRSSRSGPGAPARRQPGGAVRAAAGRHHPVPDARVWFTWPKLLGRVVVSWAARVIERAASGPASWPAPATSSTPAPCSLCRSSW